MEPNKELPPIIIKKTHGKHKPHGGAWKVAYADFVTAMMAFFIVMWVLAQSEDVKASIAAYFNNPRGMPGKSGNSAMKMKFTTVKPSTENAIFKKLGKDIAKKLEQDPQFKELAKNVKIEYTKEGMKIEILKSDAYFDVSSARLKPEGEKLLEEVGSMISKIPNGIIIEGHTDAQPYSSKALGSYDNYNLSCDRANAARVAIIRGGVSESQFRLLRGFADKNLKDPNKPF